MGKMKLFCLRYVFHAVLYATWRERNRVKHGEKQSFVDKVNMKPRGLGSERSFSSTNWWLLILPPMTLHESKVDLTRITHTVDTDNTNIIIRNHLSYQKKSSETIS